MSTASNSNRTTHTPGPWSVGVDGNNRVYGPDYRGDESGLIAVVYKGAGNKHLIAAAPDLYHALKLLDERGHTQATWDLALKAIAKAEGR